jgi:hypothetical protein
LCTDYDFVHGDLFTFAEKGKVSELTSLLGPGRCLVELRQNARATYFCMSFRSSIFMIMIDSGFEHMGGVEFHVADGGVKRDI